MRVAPLVAVVVMLSTMATGAALAAGDGTSARLRIARTHPLELRGERFFPNQYVTLRVELGAKVYKRSLRTSAAGRFATTFTSLVLDRCSNRLDVKAVGARGDKVEFELQTLPCPNTHRG
jgi:hypothetical protein